jgi:hypothetical protein
MLCPVGRRAHSFALPARCVAASGEDIISLITATADLRVVSLLRDAIRTADLSSGKRFPIAKIGPAPDIIERRFRLQPETEILPRKRIEPTPRIEPRRVIRPPDRFEPCGEKLVPIPIPDPSCPCNPHFKSPIQPPWKVLPWQEPPAVRPAPRIKVVVRPPDIVHKGSLIDFFI